MVLGIDGIKEDVGVGGRDLGDNVVLVEGCGISPPTQSEDCICINAGQDACHHN